MSNSENKRKRELECLRLASDLTRMGRDTLNPDLRTGGHRMASPPGAFATTFESISDR